MQGDEVDVQNDGECMLAVLASLMTDIRLQPFSVCPCMLDQDPHIQ